MAEMHNRLILLYTFFQNCIVRLNTLFNTAFTCMNGVECTFPAGTIVRLTPGESITLTRGLYHRFWGEEGKGTVLVREVSMTNDDSADNRFYDPVGRFPEIVEDEKPLYLLCNEY